jgi:hypothetical protein
VGDLDADMMLHMKDVAHKYSKGRGPRAGQTFHEDVTLKQGKAPEVVKLAAQKYLDPVFAKMEAIRVEEL